MKAYISVSYNKRQLVQQELAFITDVLNRYKIEPFIFVDAYKFDISQEREMMQCALEHIDQSDFLIAETSHKGIGIGIEVGYAKAKRIPIIYLRHKDAEHSTTVSGISDFRIVYADVNNLIQQFINVLKEILK